MTNRNIDPDRRLYFWFDMETNGQRLEESPNITKTAEAPWPLEVAFVITDDRFNKWGSFTKTVFVPLTILPYMIEASPSAVRQMHYANQLWADVHRTTPDAEVGNVDTRMSIAIRLAVENYARELFHQEIYTHEEYINNKRPRLVLAGSGVSHFDSRWLRHFFPETWDWIDGYDNETKPTLDIGVVRRFLEQFTPVGYIVEKPESDIKHRAMDDVLQIINEAKRMQYLLTYHYNVAQDPNQYL